MPRSERNESKVRSNKVLSWLFVTKEDQVVTGQFPNAPIIAAVVLDAISYVTSGETRTWASRGANLAFVIWSVMELGWGVNPFRRILGAVVLSLTGLALFRSMR